MKKAAVFFPQSGSILVGAVGAAGFLGSSTTAFILEIGTVKARSLEDDAGAGADQLLHLATAGGASIVVGFFHAVADLDDLAALLAFVIVGWHGLFNLL
jgi:hypothetical protein